MQISANTNELTGEAADLMEARKEFHRGIRAVNVITVTQAKQLDLRFIFHSGRKHSGARISEELRGAGFIRIKDAMQTKTSGHKARGQYHTVYFRPAVLSPAEAVEQYHHMALKEQQAGIQTLIRTMSKWTATTARHAKLHAICYYPIGDTPLRDSDWEAALCALGFKRTVQRQYTIAGNRETVYFRPDYHTEQSAIEKLRAKAGGLPHELAPE